MNGAVIFIKNNEIFVYAMNRDDVEKLKNELEKLGVHGEFRIIYCG